MQGLLYDEHRGKALLLGRYTIRSFLCSLIDHPEVSQATHGSRMIPFCNQNPCVAACLDAKKQLLHTHAWI
jgi:hypothetical protein